MDPDLSNFRLKKNDFEIPVLPAQFNAPLGIWNIGYKEQFGKVSACSL